MIKLLRFIRKNLILVLLIVHCSVFAQTFQFRNYDSNMGLPQNFIYSLEQSTDGFLWIGTGEGLVRYDGLKFTTFSVEDSLAENFVMSIKQDPEGVLWIGHNNGSITYMEDNQFNPIRFSKTNSPIRDINHDNEGNTWVTVQNSGFAKIDKNKNLTTWFDTGSLGYTLFYSIYPLGNNTILLGTSEGLMRLSVTNDGKIQRLEKFNEIPMTTITSITPCKGIQNEFWITTEDQGFYKFTLNKAKATQIIDKKLCLTFNLENENIQDIQEDDEGHLLLATWGDGVIKLFFDPQRREYTESFTFSMTNGMNNNFVKDILTDSEGNYWFATYGGGVSSLVDESMVFYDLSTIGFQDNKAHSVFSTKESLWVGLENGLIVADPYCFTDFEFYDSEMGLPSDIVKGFYLDSDETIWVATQNKGLFYKPKNKDVFSNWHYTNSSTGKKINDIKGKGKNIYLATVGGFYKLNTQTKEVIQLTTENGLPHNNINFVFFDIKNQIWVGPKNSGICKISDDKIDIHKITETPIDIFGMTHDQQGNIWLATQGRGILKYQADSLEYIDVSNGLSKNFCYSILTDNKNRLWVNHFPGLSSLDLTTNKIRNFDYKKNMGVDFYYSFTDKDENIWFASSQGVINYFPSKDIENNVAPNLNFTSIKVSGKEYSTEEDLILPFPYNGKYTFRFDFIGISFKDPKAVTYQYSLNKKGESEKDQWIDLGSTSFREYEYLPDGDYYLQIRASNADGVYNSSPLSIRIYIAPPVWKKTWFYILILSLIGYSIFVIIKLRERNLLRQKEALQREVESQTITLREQKAEIERKNRDITDSINYAKRIQSSILPESSKLKSTFNESFIFFAPRDIVSGDFYWFHNFKNKFLVCVADSTGHGVPGAFMSMIGTTLLNDIVKRNEVDSPAQILHRLDLEIKILLQKNEMEYSRDGMDISIVEIDLNNKNIRLASAKRPVYLYINEEFVIYKGNRRSIGDTIVEDDSDFVNMSYNTKKGDCIYLFSDGYPDQFGGPQGKKFMSSNIKRLLKEINKKPMYEQGEIIKDTFSSWKGNEDQVDDVVFLGIRL